MKPARSRRFALARGATIQVTLSLPEVGDAPDPGGKAHAEARRGVDKFKRDGLALRQSGMKILG
jgi:hypothetical protein